MADDVAAEPAPAGRSPVSIAGLPPGVVPAPSGRRFVAQLVDSGPVYAALVGAWWLMRDPAAGTGAVAALLGGAVAWMVLVAALLGGTGAGPGMRLTRLQLVGLTDGRPIGPVRVAVRTVVLTALRLSLVGLIAMLVRRSGQPRGQGWHDLAVNALVIEARPRVPRSNPDAPLTASRHDRSTRSTATATPTEPVDIRSGRPQHLDAAGAALASVAVPSGLEATADPPPLTPPPLTPPPLTPPPPPRGIAERSGRDDAGRAPASRPASPSEGAAPLAAPAPSPWFVVLDDGRSVSLDRMVLIGRNPFPRLDESAELVSIEDPGRTVSKTHLELGVRDGVPYVRDRGSTNGSMVTAPSGLATRCVAGQALPLSDGSLITFGDHFLRLRSESGSDQTR